MMSWRGRKAVLASRGETSGPRVDECAAALEFWRFRVQLDHAVKIGILDRDFADEAAGVAAGMAAEKMAAAQAAQKTSGLAHEGGRRPTPASASGPAAEAVSS